MQSKTISKMKKSYSLIEVAALATAFGKSTQTIIRWIENEDDRLTSDKAKKALSQINKK